jgi:geranylgeranyl diphosphate synthase type I
MDTANFLASIESELHKQVDRLDQAGYQPFHEMLTYHMGWTGEQAGAAARGKRIRPLLLFLVCGSCGAEWLRATPAAAAIELIHNFSLVHDDIQDASEKRRGRYTVWSRWGVPHAINVGDALFVIAHQSILDLSHRYPAEVVIQAAQLLDSACMDLTGGQYLDMSYEGRMDLKIEDYWPMVRGKTGALLAATCHIGALLGGAGQARQEAFRSFGEQLGLAFQVLDDILGIWGDEKVTGKSVASDLQEGKNSLPVLYGLSSKGKFFEIWNKGPLQPGDVTHAAHLLEEEGARAYAQKQAEELTFRALAALEIARPQGETGQALLELANTLLKRDQ